MQYLQLVYRNFKKNAVSSLINVFSIAIGMTAFILVVLWIKYELSFDKYNQNIENIYRVSCEGKIFENEIKEATTGSILSKSLSQTFPEIKKATAMLDFGRAMMSTPDNEGFRLKAFGATASFFEIFSVPVLQGDYKMLDQPNTAFITESAAKRIYGDENPVGKVLSTGMDHENKPFTITGIIADIPENSHFTFEFLFSINSISFYRQASHDWLNCNVYTYLQLDNNVNYKLFEKKLNEYLQTKIAPIIEQWRNISMSEWKSNGESWHFVLQPLAKIHLHSSLKNEAGQNGNITYVYMASLIGLFILIISIINFTNLSTVQSASRSKEIMVRKVTGASRKSIMAQFLAESIFYSLLALIISLILVHLFIPVFEKRTEIKILSRSSITPLMYIGSILFAIITGFIAGFYPAFVVSRMSPVRALASKFTKKAGRKIMLKDTLLILQFTISIMVIICTIAVARQLNFLQDQKLGFNKENIIIVRAMEDMSRDQQNTFKNELLKNSKIKMAAFSHRILGMSFPARTLAIPEGNNIKLLMLEVCPVEAAFFNTYEFKLAEGTFFNDKEVGRKNKIVLNEQAVKTYNISDPIGKYLYYSETEYYEIVGVTKNFHYNSKRKDIQPAAFVQEPDVEMFWSPEYLSLRVGGGDYQRIIESIKSTYQTLIPGKEFSYSFFDDDYDALYKNEMQTKQLFSIFSIIAICLSCLGLFGIVKYVVFTKIKEIGVRKVSGAKTKNIILMFLQAYLKWILISITIASPVAWYLMHKWLENFAYKTNLSWWIFAAAGAAAVLVALLTVSWQTWRAASRNPVESLRYE
ncbi:MAG: ABC transporter permease [Bacteroidales bacterium]|nr:ABC transporter permease [Bacteroidales bacterium]